MRSTEQLIADCFDADLSPEERVELGRRLEADPAALRLFLELHREHCLLGHDLRPFAEEPFVTAVLDEIHASDQGFVRRVMEQLPERALPSPGIEEVKPRWQSSEPAPSGGWGRFWRDCQSRLTGWLIPLRWIALTASTALVVGGFLWLGFQPKSVGAWVVSAHGEVRLQRGSKMIASVAGRRLCVRDILTTAPGASLVVKFQGEPTEIELGGGTEVRFPKPARGKTLDLRRGEVKAEVARQPSGRPLIIRTPHASATVLGTRFTLAARAASTWLKVTHGSVELTRTSDQHSVRVGQGHYAVAANGLDLVSRAQDGEIKPSAPQPVRISLYSEYPEDEDWLTSGESIQQRQPAGASFHPFKVPPVEGSVLLEVVATIEGLAGPNLIRGAGWGFGVGMRGRDEDVGLNLRTLQESPQGSLLHFADDAGRRTTSSQPLKVPSTGAFHLKLRIDRSQGYPALVQGKLWADFENEPEAWRVVATQHSPGPLATVAVSTLNCAVTFTHLKLFLIE